MMKEHELFSAEGKGGIGTAFLVAELNLEDIRCQRLDDCPDLTANQPTLGQVHQQGHH